MSSLNFKKKKKMEGLAVLYNFTNKISFGNVDPLCATTQMTRTRVTRVVIPCDHMHNFKATRNLNEINYRTCEDVGVLSSDNYNFQARVTHRFDKIKKERIDAYRTRKKFFLTEQYLHAYARFVATMEAW